MLWTLWFLGCFRLKVWNIRGIVPFKEAQKRVDDCHVLGYKAAYVICTEVCVVAHISCAMFEAAIWSARDFMIDWPSRGVTSLFFFSSGWKLGFFELSFLKIELHLDLLLKHRESYTSLQLFSKIRAQSRTGNKPNIFDTFFDWWKPKITIDLTLLWLINEVDFYFFSSVGLL